MGKKGRRTRWRTLTISDEHSDSEESNSASRPKGYQHKSFYGKFTYSSQSTPTRRYQCDGAKSTRSSSTASENKITFNEDEYTRITTPRQDVLFKKGYLNKPKTYQTQTSTGNSTTSTGNSTGNGTPDHQSTDLEYESQFVFPNGFVDQNGIYYVNSFEPYPVMVYNPPTYFPEYTNGVKAKRCSTGSLTESTSPNNEEASQDLSQSETPSNVSELNHHVYNVVYPGFYFNGACQPEEPIYEPEPRRLKKRRRRKPSRSKQDGTTSESSDEIFSDREEEEGEEAEEEKESKEHKKEEESETKEVTESSPETDQSSNPEQEASPTEEKQEEAQEEKEEEKEGEKVEEAKKAEEEEEKKPKYDLKPDAEEFVPRAYRHQEVIPMEAPPNVQFIKIPSNFVPVPILNPLGEFNAFIPPGIPINFMPQNYVNFVPYNKPVTQPPEKAEHENEDGETQKAEKEAEEQEEIVKKEATVEVPKNHIDIAKIVSKLEEAAKEQEDTKKTEPSRSSASSGAKKRQRYQKVELRKGPPLVSAPAPVTATPLAARTETKPVRNYSEMVKKAPPTGERGGEKRMHKSPVKEVRYNNRRVEAAPSRATDEWISVSRKKRKNKNVEETEDFVEVVEKPEEKEKLPEVKIPEEKIEEPAAVIIEETVAIIETPIAAVAVVEKVEAPPIKMEEETEEKKVKKKTKKTKTSPKRVIITDVLPTEIETKKETEEKEEEKEKKEEAEEGKAIEEAKSEEKKTKKKKKKKIAQCESDSALNLTDDSYDFLLEESNEKTNLEVSQELDRMIQRGMYSNLEEKMKTLDIESNDTLFKSIISNISSKESTDGLIKAQNLNKLLPTSTMVIPPKQTFLCEVTTSEEAPGGGEHDEDDVHPITRAVKEWMSKAGDVEVLKSPSEILQEFGYEDDVHTLSSSDGEEEYEEDLKKAQKVPKHGNLPYRAICCSIM